MNRCIHQTIRIVFFFIAANALYISIFQAFDETSLITFLYKGDLYGDFFKIPLSYPFNSKIILDKSHLTNLIINYLEQKIYYGFEGFEVDKLTHFHLPPLTTLYFLGIRGLMAYVNAATIFYTLVLLTFISLIIVIKIFISKNIRIIILYSALVFISYPFLFAIQRGNLFSIWVFILSLVFIFSTLKLKHINIGIICLAISVNIRPNSIILLPMLLFLPKNLIPNKIFLFSFYLIAILINSYLIDNYIYPEYNLINFKMGLEKYHHLYVEGPYGYGNNSSLYGMLRYLILNTKVAEILSLISSLFLAVITIIKILNKELVAHESVYLLCITGMCGTAVYADYHLMIFLIPLFLLFEIEKFTERKGMILDNLKLNSFVMYIALILIIAPKNYVNTDSISLTSILNPIIAIVSAIIIFKNSSNCMNNT
jgi:hypothetical protein